MPAGGVTFPNSIPWADRQPLPRRSAGSLAPGAPMSQFRRCLALLAVVSAALGGIACSDSSGPSSSDPTAEFDATYDLKTINDQTLPFNFSGGAQIVSERYTLKKDGTFS